MLLTRFVLTMCSVGLMLLDAGVANGQDFPNKPIRIVTAGIGGGSDFVSRLIAPGISGPLGQPVIVDNRPTGIIPGQVVSQAPPDGYTLLVNGTTFWIGALLRETPYDPIKDFAPITMATIQPNILVVHPSVRVKSVKELIALARARPGELNYSSSASGGSSHLSGELFKSMARVDIVRIPYKSGASEIADLVSGQVQLTFGGASSVGPQIQSGKLRALAVASAQPSALFPGLPTVTASGLPGYESASLQAVLAPAKTPVAIINRLNQEIVRFLKTPEANEKFIKSGVETVGSAPEQLAATIKNEMAKFGKVIKDVGIRAD